MTTPEQADALTATLPEFGVILSDTARAVLETAQATTPSHSAAEQPTTVASHNLGDEIIFHEGKSSAYDRLILPTGLEITTGQASVLAMILKRPDRCATIPEIYSTRGRWNWTRPYHGRVPEPGEVIKRTLPVGQPHIYIRQQLGRLSASSATNNIIAPSGPLELIVHKAAGKNSAHIWGLRVKP